MMWSAGDLGLVIDLGSNKPGSVLQRQENGDWRDFMVDDQPVTNPFDAELLPCGVYRLLEPSG